MVRAFSIILLVLGIVYPRNVLCASIPKSDFRHEQTNLASGFVRSNGYRSNSPNYVNDDLVRMIGTFAYGIVADDLLKGYELDVQDTKDGIWYPAKIAESVSNGRVKIHFLGRYPNEDEYISSDSDRLAVQGRYVTTWETGIVTEWTETRGFYTKRMPNSDVQIILKKEVIQDDNGSVVITLSKQYDDDDMDYDNPSDLEQSESLTGLEWSRDNSDGNPLHIITKAELDENKWVEVQIDFVGKQPEQWGFLESSLLPV
eukprot:81789_1